MSHFPDSVITLHTSPELKVALENINIFEALCRENDSFQIEKDHLGNIIIMPPTYTETGHYNFQLAGKLYAWNASARLGIAFDSSTGFTLPNGAVRSPGVSWISNERWQTLSAGQKNSFAPICPDFVIELLSFTDTLKTLHAKMEEWIANGCRLAWLIDLSNRCCYVYRPNAAMVTTGFDEPLSGEEVLPGFEIIPSQIG
ncbi:Uma2 family endonuclease [Sphingobacteriales bacterium UPWRP_1]|nr:hypothetical protein BVG80_02875 [Sphingobacteriales bacterium TSM_CSM]PSJ75427.1 Uma2 family endonuclease [Sphingobacteriales bacterium UPWRP_1]